MLTFTAAVFFLLITPGPGVLSTAGVGAAFGARPGARYVLGLFLGSNLVMVAVVSGIAAIILADPRIRTVLLAASTAYLLYLALRIALAGSKIAFIKAHSAPGIANGIALQIINPKAYVVATTMFSGFSFLPGSLLAETIVKFVILNAIWVPIHFLWLGLGIRLNQLNLPAHSQRRINIAMSLSMLIVVGLALWAYLNTQP